MPWPCLGTYLRYCWTRPGDVPSGTEARALRRKTSTVHPSASRIHTLLSMASVLSSHGIAQVSNHTVLEKQPPGRSLRASWTRPGHTPSDTEARALRRKASTVHPTAWLIGPVLPLACLLSSQGIVQVSNHTVVGNQSLGPSLRASWTGPGRIPSDTEARSLTRKKELLTPCHRTIGLLFHLSCLLSSQGIVEVYNHPVQEKQPPVTWLPSSWTRPGHSPSTTEARALRRKTSTTKTKSMLSLYGNACSIASERRRRQQQQQQQQGVDASAV